MPSLYRPALTGLLWLAAATAVQAAPVETLAELMVEAGNPDHLVLRYQDSGGGIVFSWDAGETWSMACNDALGLLKEAESMGLVDGDLYFGLFSGMQGSADGHCNWSAVDALDGKWITDMAIHPQDPQVLFAVSSNGGDVENGVYRRDAGGQWSPMGTTIKTLIGRLHAVSLPDSGLRLYTSIVAEVIEGEADGLPTYTNRYAIRYSDDEGQTWIENSYGESDGQVRLAAVDPSDPDTIIISDAVPVVVDGAESAETTLMVSDDAGQNWRSLHTMGALGGIAFAADGRLWVGDENGGLFSGRASDASLVSEDEELDVRCLAHDDANDALYVCDRFTFGRLDLESGVMEELFDVIKGNTSMLACDNLEVADICETQASANYCNTGHFPCAEVCLATYPELPYVKMCLEGDAGTTVTPSDAAAQSAPDGGSTPGMDTDPTAETADANCSCRLAGGRNKRAHWSLWAIVALVSARTLRRRPGH